MIRFTGMPKIAASRIITTQHTFHSPTRPAWGRGVVSAAAHASGFYMAFCDGSVQFMSYTIDAKTHWCLGNRSDDRAIDAKKL